MQWTVSKLQKLCNLCNIFRFLLYPFVLHLIIANTTGKYYLHIENSYKFGTLIVPKTHWPKHTPHRWNGPKMQSRLLRAPTSGAKLRISPEIVWAATLVQTRWAPRIATGRAPCNTPPTHLVIAAGRVPTHLARLNTAPVTLDGEIIAALSAIPLAPNREQQME